MRRIAGYLLATCMALPVGAQSALTLDSCRQLALHNNKQLAVARVKQNIATNMRKSARTKYLPRVTALAGYEYTSREISLLSDDQKKTFSNLGTHAASTLGGKANEFLQTIPQSVWQQLGQLGYTQEGVSQQLTTGINSVTGTLNQTGMGIVDAFHTDTRNIWAGAVMVTQPVFMGGAITATNRLAVLGEQLAANSAEAERQLTLYNIDQAYWQVVSLRHKQKLAQSYLDLVKKLDSDVEKMIAEGVATRSEGLSVSVKVNEAEMTLAKVDDGLALSKMYLAQLCGLPLDGSITLADEDSSDITQNASSHTVDIAAALGQRPEIRMLQNTLDMNEQSVKLIKAGNLPQVALVGGYAVSNPNVYNGFERKFGGVWNIGVLVRVPVWNWGDVAYKVRAAKGASAIATLELDEAKEKIELQVNQSSFRLNEANKKLKLAKASTRRAEENLRTANIGFREGVIQSTTVMEAQTAWLQAQSQRIDAEIDVRLSQTNLQKALGTLGN